MHDIAQQVARRTLEALPTVRRRLLVRDRCGRADVVDAVVAAWRASGVEVLVEHRADDDLRHLLATTVPDDWTEEACRARGEFPTDVDALVTLGGWGFDASGVDPVVLAAWGAAVARGSTAMDDAGVLTLVVAVPTDAVAVGLGLDPADLEERVLPGVLCDPAALQREAEALVAPLATTGVHELRSPGCVLRLDRGDRPFLLDDGRIDAGDVQRHAVVSNLPGGSVYWTVLEDRTRGDVRTADGTVLRFGDDGRVVDGPYAGERVSHLGIGANPAVSGRLGWTLVDEHRPGAVFLALGENRYLGGANASDVNVDLVVDGEVVPGPV